MRPTASCEIKNEPKEGDVSRFKGEFGEQKGCNAPCLSVSVCFVVLHNKIQILLTNAGTVPISEECLYVKKFVSCKGLDRAVETPW